MAIVGQSKKPQTGLHLIGILMSICAVIPFILVISASFTSASDLARYGFGLWPKKVDIGAYKMIFENPTMILRSYWVTFLSTVLTLVGSLFVQSTCAYALARPNFTYRRPLTFYFFFTMLFGGGLVPSYILITHYLKMKNTIAVMVVPGLMSVYNCFVMRTFMQKLPDGLFEAAKIDGASEFRIYGQIALPLSVPSLATVGFFTAMGKWNDSGTGLYYIDDSKLYQLQFMLQTISKEITTLLKLMEMGISSGLTYADIPGDNMLMAMAVVATGPMLVAFPLFQKYFVSGLTLGSVKG